MSDLILKEHGAHAIGKVSHSKDGRWAATFLVKDLDKCFEQRMGPEFFASEHDARRLDFATSRSSRVCRR